MLSWKHVLVSLCRTAAADELQKCAEELLEINVSTKVSQFNWELNDKNEPLRAAVMADSGYEVENEGDPEQRYSDNDVVYDYAGLYR